MAGQATAALCANCTQAKRAGPKLRSRAVGVRDVQGGRQPVPLRDEREANLEQRGLRNGDAWRSGFKLSALPKPSNYR